MKVVLLNNANKLIISHFSFFISHFSLYLCTRFQKAGALSSAGLEHLPYKQRVGGSNPSAPTTKEFQNILGLFFVNSLIFITFDLRSYVGYILEMKINLNLFCISLDLHYLCSTFERMYSYI